jgi:hypothetical protein
MKVCSTCNISKPLDAFLIREKKKGTRVSQCHDCRKATKKRSYEKGKEGVMTRQKTTRRSKAEWFQEVKDPLSCQECGESDNACLDFHHLDPATKEFAVSAVQHYGKQRVLDEIAKCAVLCANCHRKHHAGRLPLTS